MLVHVTEARHRGGHRVWLRFNDGVEGEIDLSTAPGITISEEQAEAAAG